MVQMVPLGDPSTTQPSPSFAPCRQPPAPEGYAVQDPSCHGGHVTCGKWDESCQTIYAYNTDIYIYIYMYIYIYTWLRRKVEPAEMSANIDTTRTVRPKTGKYIDRNLKPIPGWYGIQNGRRNPGDWTVEVGKRYKVHRPLELFDSEILRQHRPGIHMDPICPERWVCLKILGSRVKSLHRVLSHSG